MVALIRRERHFLSLLTKTTQKQRRALLNTITRDQLKAISEIVHNINKSNIILSEDQKRKLRKKRRLIYVLGQKRLGYDRKSALVKSHPRLILTLLQIATAHLESVIG